MKTTVRKNSDEQPSTSGYKKRQKIDENASDSSTECSDEDAAHPRTMYSAQSLGKTGVKRSSTLPKQNIDSEENTSQSGRRECYDAAGLKRFFHGIIYQSKLLIHFLERGLDQRKLNVRYCFGIATEMIAAEKFDDVVFRYKDNYSDTEFTYRFVQAKHKIDKTIVIREDDLLDQKDGDFSLPKYFVSFLRIGKNSLFRDGELRDFTIFTNISLDKSLEVSCFESVNRDDEIFDFKTGKRLKLNLNKFPNYNELESALVNVSDCKILAKQLAECISKGNIINFKEPLFKLYHRALRKHVIEVKDKQRAPKRGDSEGKYVVANFFENFARGHNLSSSAQSFRNVFFSEYFNGPPNQAIKIAHSFVKYFDPEKNAILSDAKELAKEIFNCIDESKNGTVILSRKKKYIQNDIDKLAGFVFTKRPGTDPGIYHFSKLFLDKSYAFSSGDLKSFKTESLKLLKNKDELLNLEFRIADFATCEDNEVLSQIDLPDEVSEQNITDFFNHLVFAVGMPGESELNDIIAERMAEKFGLVDSEFPTSKLAMDIQEWMNATKGYFLTDEYAEDLVKNIRKKILVLNVSGITLKYRTEIEAYGMEFSDMVIPSNLTNFLTSTTNKQIFNLISSCEVTTLSAIKVFQALKDTNAYKAGDSFIAIHLDSISDDRIRNCIAQAFSSEVSNNLLVIECGAAEVVDRQQLLLSLFSTIKKYNKKKLFS